MRKLLLALVFAPAVAFADTEQPLYEVPDPATAENFRLLSYQADQHRHQGADGSSLLVNAVPIGTVLPYASTTTIPKYWLQCQGQSLSTTTYSALFNVIGYVYGGSGASFTLPDLRARFAVGFSSTVTAVDTMGETGGSISHTHTAPAHAHGMGAGANLNITASGAHGHEFFGRINSAGGTDARPVRSNGSGDAANQSAGMPVNNTETHTHGSSSISGSIGLVTGGVDGNASMTSGTNNPPYLTITFIIFTGV